jgi:oxygen-independent coproporphyrinogen-3 oxidase
VRFDGGLSAKHHDALLREISNYTSRDDALPVDSLCFGGGTSSLTPHSIATVIDEFGPLPTDSAQIAIEAYPTHATPGQLADLRAVGVNRVSLGSETLDRKLPKKLGRRYSPEQAVESVLAATAAGFDAVDAKPIFGIPGQDNATFLAAVRECLTMGVDQISA